MKPFAVGITPRLSECMMSSLVSLFAARLITPNMRIGGSRFHPRTLRTKLPTTPPGKTKSASRQKYCLIGEQQLHARPCSLAPRKSAEHRGHAHQRKAVAEVGRKQNEVTNRFEVTKGDKFMSPKRPLVAASEKKHKRPQR